jgi:hypothetical protein
MRIKQDLLRVRPALAVNGEKLEAEQMPMQRVQTVDAPANIAGNQVGSIPTEIITDTTVGEMAANMRHPCFSCKNWNRRAWKALYMRWVDPTTPIAERQQLNAIRAALLTTNNATIHDRNEGEDGTDVEHALGELGICEPLTEIRKDPVIVYPTATCPPEVRTPQQPDGLYKAKDRDNARMGGSVFDNVMRLATGKK